MKNELVSFELAKLAKKVGFEEDCEFAYADDGFQTLHFAFDLTGEMYFTNQDITNAKENGEESWLAPTQSLLQRWYREVHKIDVSIETGWSQRKDLADGFIYEVCIWRASYDYGLGLIFNTFEQALEAGLIEAGQIIKKLKDNEDSKE